MVGLTAPSKIIAIVGSAQPARTNYEPPLRNTAQVKKACAELGHALALAGYRIMVYSSDETYIEADIVKSYVESGAAKDKSIVIRYPDVVGKVAWFKEQATHPQLFVPDPDDYDNWQVSFYTSLKQVDGILLLGGGNSALITGLVAHMYSIPLVCIATFGGSAHTVWSISKDNPLFSAEERQLMNAPTWVEDKGDGQGSAARLVAVLKAQRERKRALLEAEEARVAAVERQKASEIKKRTVVVVLLLALTGALAACGFSQRTGVAGVYSWFVALFFITPLLGGALGGVAGDLFELWRGRPYNPNHVLSAGAALGALAGFVSILFLFAAQVSTNYETFKDIDKNGIPFGFKLLFLFVVVISLVAGFTVESVLRKLKRMDALKPDSLLPAPAGLGGGAPSRGGASES